MFRSSRSRQSDMFPGRSGYSDMFPRQSRLLRHVRLQTIPLERHVLRAEPASATCSDPADPARATCSPADPATATCWAPADPARATCSPGRSGYCDMFRSSRPRYCDMFPRQSRLLRHVRLQTIPLERHVLRAEPASATCWAPADPARATCSPGRSGYCDMFRSSRPRYCDIFPRQSRLLRHVRLQPIPLERHVVRAEPLVRHVGLQPTPPERHVPRADPATATCSDPADPATATCSPGRAGYCDMFASNRSR